MQIEVLSVSVEDKGKYKMAEVAYKGSDGKVTSKKLMSFGAGADVFATLKDSKTGDKYSVTTVKNDKGYWDWTSIQSGHAVAGTTSTPAASNSPRSTYETPEERAARQVYIVRQSSISSAVELLSLNNPKGGVTPQQVIEVAGAFENYVFGRTGDPMDSLESDIV